MTFSEPIFLTAVPCNGGYELEVQNATTDQRIADVMFEGAYAALQSLLAPTGKGSTGSTSRTTK
jgi:hypothetical protein